MGSARFVTAFVASTLILAGCLEPSVTECPWGLYCAADRVCSDVIKKCVFPMEIQACRGKANGTPCDTVKANGECYEEVCAEPECGDGLRFESEGCDDGNTLDYDGCSSGCITERVRWKKLVLSGAPSGRAFAAMAYDAVAERVVLFGGGDGAGYTNDDTWTLEISHDAWPPMPSAWQKMQVSDRPPGRSHHAMVFDTLKNEILLTGGQHFDPGPEPRDDTWVFDGVSWDDITPQAGSVPRRQHSLVWDEKYERAILFGGTRNSASLPVDELWIFDGVRQVWENRGSAGNPPPRTTPMTALDPGSNSIMMTAGVGDRGTPGMPYGKCLPEMWELELSSLTWKEVQGATLSPCLRSTAGAFEHLSGLIVLFGGEPDGGGAGGVPLQETWVLRNRTWEKGAREGVAQPPARRGHSLVSLGKKGWLLLFGGIDASGKLLDDTWVGRVDTDRCGNGHVDEEEGCDGQVFAKDKEDKQLDCRALGYTGGKLTCDSCRVDTSSCTK
jgi:cysteine-rich repeat protein